nr:MAG: RNA-dependent RNA polymerase [Wufeng shrew dicistrovirus 13]
MSYSKPLTPDSPRPANSPDHGVGYAFARANEAYELRYLTQQHFNNWMGPRPSHASFPPKNQTRKKPRDKFFMMYDLSYGETLRYLRFVNAGLLNVRGKTRAQLSQHVHVARLNDVAVLSLPVNYMLTNTVLAMYDIVFVGSHTRHVRHLVQSKFGLRAIYAEPTDALEISKRLGLDILALGMQDVRCEVERDIKDFKCMYEDTRATCDTNCLYVPNKNRILPHELHCVYQCPKCSLDCKQPPVEDHTEYVYTPHAKYDSFESDNSETESSGCDELPHAQMGLSDYLPRMPKFTVDVSENITTKIDSLVQTITSSLSAVGLALTTVHKITSLVLKLFAMYKSKWDWTVCTALLLDYLFMLSLDQSLVDYILSLFSRLVPHSRSESVVDSVASTSTEVPHAQFGIRDFAFDSEILTTLLVCLSSAALVSKIPAKGSIADFLKTLNITGRAIYGAEKVVSFVSSVFTKVIDFVYFHWYGHPRVINKLEDFVSGVTNFYKEVQELNKLDEADKITTDVDMCRRVENLYIKGLELTASIGEVKPDPATAAAFRIHFLTLEKLYSKVDKSGARSGGPRVEPIVIQLHGSTGVGKSGVTYPIAVDILKCAGLEKEWSKQVYFRNIEQEYWDGYYGQHVCVYDDFAQSYDTVQSPNLEFLEVIRSCNIAPYPLHMANLEDKSKAKFRSRCILLSSNTKSLSPSSITHPSAFTRRIDMSIGVLPKAQYATMTNLTPNSGPVPVLDPIKIKNLLNTDISLDVYDFYECDVLTGVVTSPAMDYDTMIAKVTALYKAKFDRSQSMIKFLNERAGIPHAQMSEDSSSNSSESESESETETVAGEETPMCTHHNPINTATGREFLRLEAFKLRKEAENIEELLLNFENDTYISKPSELPLSDFGRRLLAVSEKATVAAKDFIGRMVDLIKENGTTIFAATLCLAVTGALYIFWPSISECVKKIKKKWYSSHESKQEDLVTPEAYGIVTPGRPVVKHESGMCAAESVFSVYDRIKEWYNGAGEVVLPPTNDDLNNTSQVIAQMKEYAVPQDVDVYVEELIDNECNNRMYNLGERMNVSVWAECKTILKGFMSVCCLSPLVEETVKRIPIIGFPSFILLENALKLENMEKNNLSRIPECLKIIATTALHYVTRYHLPMSSAVFVHGLWNAVTAGVWYIKNRKMLVNTSNDDTMFSNCSNAYVRGTIDPELPKGEAFIDANAQQIISQRILQNLYAITFTTIHGVRAEIKCLFVRGRIAVTVKHMLATIDKTLPVNIKSIFLKTGYDFPFEDLNIIVHDEKDLAFIEFPNSVMTHPDIVGHFTPKTNFAKFVSAPINLVTVRHATVAKINHLVPCFVSSPKAEAFDTDLEYTLNNSKIYCRQYYSYPAETTDGDCGAPIIISDTRIASKICGIHFAGKKGMGYAVALSQDLLSDYLARFVPHAQLKLYLDDNLYDIDNCLLPRGEFVPVGKISPAPPCGRASSLRPSMIHNVAFQSTMKPAQLYRKDGIDPLYVGLEKCGVPPVYIDPSKIENAQCDIQSILLNNINPLHQRVLSMAEAIEGVENDEFLAPINRRSSPGYPWCLNTSGHMGKTKWCGVDEYVLDNPELQCAVNKRLECAKLYERVPTFWIDTLKDEKRAIEKVEAGKTRVFSVGPLDYLVLSRMYFLGYLAHIMHNRISNEVAVGTNVYDYDWNRIARSCCSKGANVIAGDFSNFDGTLNVQVLKAILEDIIVFYKSGPFWHADMEPVFRVLFDEIVHSLHVVGDNVYFWTHSQPSGNPLTAIINSEYNKYVVRIAFQIVVGEDKMLEFRVYVYMIAYGDDNIINVHPRYVLFNQFSIAEAFKTIGMIYTDESKSGTTFNYRTLSEVTFLKRSFVFDHEECRMIAPLNLDTITEMTQWIRNTMDPDLATLENVETAVRELSLWPSAIFKEYSQKLVHASILCIGKRPKVFPRSLYRYAMIH